MGLSYSALGALACLGAALLLGSGASLYLYMISSSSQIGFTVELLDLYECAFGVVARLASIRFFSFFLFSFLFWLTIRFFRLVRERVCGT